MVAGTRKPRPRAPSRLSLSVQYAVAPPGDRVPTRAQIRRWAGAALSDSAVVTVRIVSEPEGRELNRQFRGKDYATNVLTFSLDDALAPEFAHCADIVLCAPVVEREAHEQHKSLEAHYAHLVVHGLLHMQGYDHETESEAAVMEALESRIVMKLGYPDPYAAA
ncbi:MAG: rRNA maturation RNase YbeY [Betaproteobacteria bacterium]|nr:rRNA maturation RNase YbeY [Betaproteobacteria bacterium]